MIVPKFAVAFVLVMTPLIANAGTNGESQCAAIDDSAARLACYDTANPPLHPTRALTPSNTNKEPESDRRAWYDLSISPAQQTQPEQFGSESLKPPVNDGSNSAPPRPEPIESISAGVTDYTIDSLGHFVVMLDNGQVWKQSQNDNGHARFRKNRPNAAVISRGLLGGYGLVLNDGVASYTVRRIK